MDMQVMVSVDKTPYEGLSRLSILTGTFVCLQMSDGGQIQQQDPFSSFLSSPQHHLSFPKFLLILRKIFS